MSCEKGLNIVWEGTLHIQYSAQSSLYVQYIERGVFIYWNGKKNAHLECLHFTAGKYTSLKKINKWVKTPL